MGMSGMGGFSERVLSLAVAGLVEVDAGRPLDDVVDGYRVDPAGSAAADILFKYYRRKGEVDHLLSKTLSKVGAERVPGRTRRLTLVVLIQSLWQGGVASESAANIAVGFLRKKGGRRAAGFLNAILRAALSMDVDGALADAPEWVGLRIPRFFSQRWSAAGEGWAEMLRGIRGLVETPPPLAFRVVGDALSDAELANAGCEPLAVPGLTDGFRFFQTGDAAAFFARGWIEGGAVRIQDPATSLPLRLVDDAGLDGWCGGLVLDLCSAPGGKALMFTERLSDSGRLVVCDVSLRRMGRVIENFGNMGQCALSAVASALSPPFAPGVADLVLLDVPCSNTGVFRRRPDVLWGFSERKLAELMALQGKMLESAAPLVKPGGLLVYSTCSLEPEENGERVAAFLDAHADFRKLSDRAVFPTLSHDGAYAAVFARERL